MGSSDTSVHWDLGVHLFIYLGGSQTQGQLLTPLWGRDREGGLDLWTLTHTCRDTPECVTQERRGPAADYTTTMDTGARPPCGARRGLQATYFFRGACLPLRCFFRACLATATLGESHDGGGVFGGSAASDFWFGKGARGPLLVSLLFCSSDFTALRITFPAFLFSTSGQVGNGFVYSMYWLSSPVF